MELVKPDGTILDQVAIPALDSPDTVSVNWSLTAGSQYYLLQGPLTTSNGMWNNWSQPAPSDTEITMTDTGIFSYSPVAAGFTIGGPNAGIGNVQSGTEYWADFTNIITTSGGTGVPEPTSFILVLPFAAAVLLRARRFRS